MADFLCETAVAMRLDGQVGSQDRKNLQEVTLSRDRLGGRK